MTDYRITSPDPAFNGVVGDGVVFSKGVALLSVDHDANRVDGATNLPAGAAALAYFKRRGYGVEDVTVPERPVAVDDVQPPAGPKLPSKTATKADWVAYAVALKPEDGGLTDAEANALTRDQLAEKYTEAAK